jgi:hypothetical protein
MSSLLSTLNPSQARFLPRLKPVGSAAKQLLSKTTRPRKCSRGLLCSMGALTEPNPTRPYHTLPHRNLFLRRHRRTRQCGRGPQLPHQVSLGTPRGTHPRIRLVDGEMAETSLVK